MTLRKRNETVLAAMLHAQELKDEDDEWLLYEAEQDVLAVLKTRRKKPGEEVDRVYKTYPAKDHSSE